MPWITFLFSVFFSGKCGPGDLCFTMLEQMENIDTKLGDYGDYLHVDKQKYKYSYKYTNENNGKTLTHCSAITQTPNYKKWRTLTVGSQS